MPSAADDRRSTPSELIARISAERGSSAVTGSRHDSAGSVVTPPALPRRSPERSLGRQLAPLAVGATAMLIVASLASIVFPPPDTATVVPGLSSVIVQDPNDVASTPGTTPVTPTHPDLGPATVAAGTAPTPGPPTPPTAPGAADGPQAATNLGWTLVGGDEFDGGRSPMWGDDNGEGPGGNGSRTSAALTVENGSLVIRGDAQGNTGGTAWKRSQRFGKWEVRARFPKGDAQYHPVLVLWPTDRERPEGGEIDFAQTDGAADDVSFVLHHGPGNQQEFANRDIDVTQWHTYAVDWAEGQVTGYLDGVEWFRSTDPAALPPGEMHPAIRLDYFPTGVPPQPTEMHVDYMRVYR